MADIFRIGGWVRSQHAPHIEAKPSRPSRRQTRAAKLPLRGRSQVPGCAQQFWSTAHRQTIDRRNRLFKPWDGGSDKFFACIQSRANR
jgi:hypothetical protein